MGWMIGVLEFDSWQGLGIFFFTTVLRMALRSTQPPIQWIAVALYLGVKWPEHEANHSSPSSAKAKMRGAMPPPPNTLSWRGAQLKKKHRD